MGDRLEDEAGRLAAVASLKVVDTPPEGPFDHIVELTKTALDFPIGAVTLITEDVQFHKAHSGLDVVAIPRSGSLCNHTIKQRDVFVVEDVTAHPRFANVTFASEPPFVCSYAGAPLIMADGYQVGALCVMDTRPRTLTEDQKEMLAGLANCVVRELELRRTAAMDDLTGMMRRASFFNATRTMMSAAVEHGDPCALALIDIDRFKAINDTFGHLSGDEVLSRVADFTNRALGDKAVTGRVGGEEFAACLPRYDEQGAHAMLEALRAGIAAENFPAVSGEQVTVSIGLAMMDSADPSLAPWYKAADAALYGAKHAGRNRIVVADGTADPTERPRTLPYIDLTQTTAPKIGTGADKPADA
ncbi:MAG: sensor domain-containing diguanylate cyclase [Pseudomonadota bacterium]